MIKHLTACFCICVSTVVALLPTDSAAGRFEALFAPSAELWPRWERHDPNSTIQVSHAEWDRFLKRHVITGQDGVARIGYGRVPASDAAALSGYIDALSATDVDGLNRDQQFAYWVNLYNALTVKVVLDHYPVESIRDIDISPGFFADGPWSKALVTVAGEELTLNDIEHRILRPIWQDPRIHYVVNCASIGCPNLDSQALTAETLEATLDRAAARYINDARGAKFRNGQLVASSIYAWFQKDFGNSDTAVIRHLNAYATPELQEKLKNVTEIFDFDYDWSLNNLPTS